MRLRALLLMLVIGAVAPASLPSVAFAKEGQPQPPKDFVPVEDAPQGEQIPAMPLIGAAYGFIWVGVLGYVWSLGRRLQKVEAEISALERRSK
jgi:CcmD family protein